MEALIIYMQTMGNKFFNTKRVLKLCKQIEYVYIFKYQKVIFVTCVNQSQTFVLHSL